MQLSAAALLERLDRELLVERQGLSTIPGLALIWVGDDPATGRFIRAKQAKAKLLNCDFQLHHFDNAPLDQLKALIGSLNVRKDTHGIILQLPLPKSLSAEALISYINPDKDVDNLRGGSVFVEPTPTAIVSLLEKNNINPAKLKTVIIGSGRLVGGPLAELFRERRWPVTQISRDAENEVSEINQHDILIASTGVAGLIQPRMVHPHMIVIDGSGVDVEVEMIEPLVKMVTPKRGAIGPLTINYLFANLLKAAHKFGKR